MTTERLAAARNRVDKLVDRWLDAALNGDDDARRALLPDLAAAASEYANALDDDDDDHDPELAARLKVAAEKLEP